MNACANKEDEEASAVFDLALAVVSVFHMIEWVRWTVFLTSALVNVNLVPVFYLLSINIPYGFIALVIGILARYGEDGADCAMTVEEGMMAKQPERANYLAL